MCTSLYFVYCTSFTLLKTRAFVMCEINWIWFYQRKRASLRTCATKRCRAQFGETQRPRKQSTYAQINNDFADAAAMKTFM